jgi:hypothetical protein
VIVFTASIVAWSLVTAGLFLFIALAFGCEWVARQLAAAQQFFSAIIEARK